MPSPAARDGNQGGQASRVCRDGYDEDERGSYDGDTASPRARDDLSLLTQQSTTEDERERDSDAIASARTRARVATFRATSAAEERTLHAGDISAAFRRIDQFTTATTDLEAGPTGPQFGTGNSPSLYQVLGELHAERAHRERRSTDTRTVHPSRAGGTGRRTDGNSRS